MKILYAFGLFLFAINIWAQEEQTANLTHYRSFQDKFYTGPELESGTYILIRDHETPEQVNIKIRRKAKRTKIVRPSGSLPLARNPFTGQIQLFENGRTVPVMQEKIINLDFSKLPALVGEETEKVVLELDFQNDRIKIKEASIEVEDSDRTVKIKRRGIFLPQDIDKKFKFIETTKRAKAD